MRNATQFVAVFLLGINQPVFAQDENVIQEVFVTKRSSGCLTMNVSDLSILGDKFMLQRFWIAGCWLVTSSAIASPYSD